MKFDFESAFTYWWGSAVAVGLAHFLGFEPYQILIGSAAGAAWMGFTSPNNRKPDVH